MTHKHFLAPCLTIVINALTICLTTTTATQGAERTCPSAAECRDIAPQGKLLHNLQSDGKTQIWTAPCGPNALSGGHDLICEDMVSCPAAGGFGEFLKAVS